MKLRRIAMAMLAAGGLVLAGANTVAAAPGGQSAVHAHRVCATGKDGLAGCPSWVVPDAKGKPKASSGPTGLSPAKIKTAYGYGTSTTAGAGKTIAIVDAYDDPTALSDFNPSSTHCGPPPSASSPCSKKVTKSGATKPPRVDAGWALE